MCQLFQTTGFAKTVKKIHSSKKKAIEHAIAKIQNNHLVGDKKKGDLSHVFVYKFKIHKEEHLLAYTLNEKEKKIVLLAFGSHENFYRDLKRK